MYQHEQLNALILRLLRDHDGRKLTIEELLRFIRPVNETTTGQALKIERAASNLRRGKERQFQPSSVGGSNKALLRPITPAMRHALAGERQHGLELRIGPLIRRLETLQDLGLVKLGRKPMLDRTQLSRRVSIAPKFVEIQREIGFSLTEDRTANVVGLTPVFGKPVRRDIDVFIIMPFATELETTYTIIQDACRQFSLHAVRGNEMFGATHVIEDIWSALFFCRAVICDCTGRNPNVFYELGIAHTLGKQVMLLSKNEADIPFDLRHWRFCIYNDNQQLRNGVCDALVSILNVGAGATRG
jgi:hypothetical protein